MFHNIPKALEYKDLSGNNILGVFIVLISSQRFCGGFRGGNDPLVGDKDLVSLIDLRYFYGGNDYAASSFI